MKRTAMVIVVVAVALVAAGAAFAQMGSGPSMGYGRGQYGSGPESQVNIENMKKFQKETLGLRDELMTKRAELHNEYIKETPDTARIAEIQKQMIDIRTKIQKVAEKNGLPAWGPGHGRRGMGRGMMAGSGACGCGCPGWGQ
jgi:zinc resistance-associated protein